MEEFKVREVDFEGNVLNSNEETKAEETKTEEVKSEEAPIEENPAQETKVEETPVEESKLELSDDLVINYLKEKSGRDFSSLDDVLSEKVVEKELELPEDVEAYYKYKKETGRNLEDFLKLNRDLDSESPEKLLKDYIKETNPEFDNEDVMMAMEEFSFDEELDDDSTIKRAKLAKKKELARAKEYFNKLKEQYKVPLESSESQVSNEELDAFKQYKESQTTLAEDQRKRSDYFKEKTDSLFSDKFEGFKFKLDDKTEMTYKPAEAQALKEKQMSLNSFVGSFLDDNGYLKDAELFHRAIAIASEPEKFAKFFYDKGKTDMVTDFEKEGKNIDMVRSGSPTSTKQGLRVRAVDSSNTKGLKFKKR